MTTITKIKKSPGSRGIEATQSLHGIRKLIVGREMKNDFLFDQTINEIFMKKK